MKLYYSPGACSLAAHIAAKEAGLPLQLERVDLKTHRTEKHQDYYAVNPKGYVPALQMDDGETLTENVAILNYLADHGARHFDTPRPGTLKRYRLEEWLGFITTELHKSFAPLLQGGAEEEKEKAREKIVKRLSHVDEQMRDKKFLMGERMSVADAYLFVILTWTRKMHIDTARFSNLEALYKRMSEQSSVQAALDEEGIALPQ